MVFSENPLKNLTSHFAITGEVSFYCPRKLLCSAIPNRINNEVDKISKR